MKGISGAGNKSVDEEHPVDTQVVICLYCRFCSVGKQSVLFPSYTVLLKKSVYDVSFAKNVHMCIM